MVTIDHARGNQVALRWLQYDGHGTLVRTMAPDYTLSGWQWRGVWGERTEATAGRGYCANLGHPEDETGLVYMRARYYEPATGRFISEDPSRDGLNWYLYADGNPVNKVDKDGFYTLMELLWGGANEAFDEQAAAANALLAKQWGQNAIQRILTKWAEKFTDTIFDRFSIKLLEEQIETWGFRWVGNSFRLDIVGVDGKFRVALDLLHDVPHVNFYRYGLPGSDPLHFVVVSTFFP